MKREIPPPQRCPADPSHPPEEAKTLKECIQMADARMYNVKKSRHIARGQ